MIIQRTIETMIVTTRSPEFVPDGGLVVVLFVVQIWFGTSSIKWPAQPEQVAVHWLLPAQKNSPAGQAGPVVFVFMTGLGVGV